MVDLKANLKLNFWSLEKFASCKRLFYKEELEKEPVSKIETGFIIGELLLNHNIPQNTPEEKLRLAKVFKYKKPDFVQVSYNEELSYFYNNMQYEDIANIIENNGNSIVCYCFEENADHSYHAKDSIRSLLIGMMLYKKYNIDKIIIKLIFLKQKKLSKYLLTTDDISKVENFLIEQMNRISNLSLQGEDAFEAVNNKYCQNCPYCEDESQGNNLLKDVDNKIIAEDLKTIAEDTAKQIIALESTLAKLYDRLENICIDNNMTIEVDGHIFKPVERHKYKISGSMFVDFLIKNGRQPLDYIKPDDDKMHELLHSEIGQELKNFANIETFVELEHKK